MLDLSDLGSGWQDKQAMNYDRIAPGLAVHGSKLFAFGAQSKMN